MPIPDPPETPDDADLADLVRRLRRDDRAALAELFARVGRVTIGRLRRLFGGRVGDDDLQDAVQHALVRTWERRAALEPGGHVAAWFHVVARRRLLDVLRARARERAVPLDEAAHAATAVVGDDDVAADDAANVPEVVRGDVPGDVPRATARRALIEEVRAVLDTLDETDRRILAAFAEGRRDWAKALSEDIDLSAGAIRVRRLRAQARIEERLARLLDGARGPEDRP